VQCVSCKASGVVHVMVVTRSNKTSRAPQWNQ
jgi:hypothetical protein